MLDFHNKCPKKRYFSSVKTLEGLPKIRRDLIKRHLYLVPNSLVVTRGCPHHCDFCYKDAFFQGGKAFYVQQVDDVLAEIERLPGRHLYFLDDHLFGNRPFAENFFEGMSGMNRVFQGAATVDSILRTGLVEKAAHTGLRSLFVGFETLNPKNLLSSNKKQNLGKDYRKAIQHLHDNGVMINGSFVFGLDDDDESVFRRTVNWGLENGITTATYHILTPYPGTRLYQNMHAAGRLTTAKWNLYDTRSVVFRPVLLSQETLQQGYNWAYKEFYNWNNILKASLTHPKPKHILKHFAYTSGWKKFEPVWNFLIKTRRLNSILPMLEAILSEVKYKQQHRASSEHQNMPRNNAVQSTADGRKPMFGGGNDHLFEPAKHAK